MHGKIVFLKIKNKCPKSNILGIYDFYCLSIQNINHLFRIKVRSDVAIGY